MKNLKMRRLLDIGLFLIILLITGVYSMAEEKTIEDAIF